MSPLSSFCCCAQAIMNLLRLPHKRWCDFVKSKWICGHPIWMNDNFLLWKLGWTNIFDGHFSPTPGASASGNKHHEWSDPTYYHPEAVGFEGPASLPLYCSLATCSWNFGCWWSWVNASRGLVCHIKRPFKHLPVLFTWGIISSKLMISKNI